MANRFFSPNQQFADTTGLPYAGGSLTFYASGTSTPLATYSNRALTIPNTNPVVLDSAGRAGDIFLQNLAYKVVLASDALGLVPIWTADPVYASDFSTTASFLSGAGSPNGVVAGSAGSPTVPASVYWDTTNNILYVATTTGNAATTVWTAVNASTAAAVVPSPQGYLTITSGVPIILSDVISATGVFYTPYVGNLVPIYNGSSFVPTVFTELFCTFVAAHTANNIYDVFVFNNSGVPTLVTGPSWSAGTSGSITAGSCARGTGAGGTALSRVSGFLTNAVQITGRNGATTYTINANLATYLGSVFIDGTNGLVSSYRNWGKDRKWGVWNAYNRVNIFMQEGDSTVSWTATTTYPVWAAPNADATNRITVFTGLAEEQVSCVYNQQGAQLAVNRQVLCGMGLNSTTTSSGTYGSFLGVGSDNRQTTTSFLVVQPALGINVIQALNTGNGSSVQFNGTQPSMQMTTAYRG